MITVNNYSRVGNSYVYSGNEYSLFSIESIIYAAPVSISQSEIYFVYFADGTRFVTDLAGIEAFGPEFVSINEYKRTSTRISSKIKDTGIQIKVNVKNVSTTYPFGIGYKTNGVTQVDCIRLRLTNGTHIITDEAGLSALDGNEATYKVYTALLTQSGDGNPEGIINSPLVIGRTYQIDNDGVPSGTWDFTNVGAPNNDIGTYFVATGTTPNNWGTNIVLAYTNGAPVVTVLENTIGNIWFTYGADGVYIVNCSDVIFNQNTYMIVGNPTWDAGVGYIQSGFDGNVGIIGTHSDFLTGNEDCGLLINTPIEIRVYN